MTQPEKSNNSKTRWTPNQEDIYHILQEHKNWLESDSQDGYRAEINHADLSGIDLSGANLRGAKIIDTFLYDTDLSNADLSETEGIKPEHLAGANLSGALLPENIEQFETLNEIKKHSKQSRYILWGTLILLHFCWIMLLSISNANLLSRIHLLPSLMPELYIPAFWFFAALPIILFVLYIFLNKSLQRNWKNIANLPSIFPDAVPVDKKIFKWHVNNLAIPHLRKNKAQISLFHKLFNIFLIYTIHWVVPQTLAWFWLQYLIRHDWGLTIYHIFFIALSILFAFYFHSLMKRTLRRQKPQGNNIFLRLVYFAVILIPFVVVSLGIIQAVPQKFENSSFTIGPKIVSVFGYELFLDFSEGEISKKPADWDGSNQDISSVAGANLKGLYAPYSNGRKAFLVKADLTYANLKYNNLDSADLRGVNLYGAKLNNSSLIGTNLEAADLSGTYLDGVNLLGANLRDVKGLTIQALRKTNNWLYAQYGGSILDSLNLPADHNKKMADKDLSGYDLQNTDFRGFNLAGFNFSGANLQAANLTDVDLTGANLFSTDLRGVVGLKKENLQTALNWFFALYDEELMTTFGLPANHVELTGKKDFRTYNFEGINLTGADFKGANLRQVNMKNAILHNVNLQDADLYAVDLTGADLTGANFKSTILLDTDIRGANLKGVKNLTMEQLRWALFDAATTFPDTLKDPAAERLLNK